MPRDPQGAGTRTETRTETKVEWRNVYRVLNRCGDWEARVGGFESLEQTHASPRYRPSVVDDISYPRVAIEEVTTTITRYPIPPHVGEETKG